MYFDLMSLTKIEHWAANRCGLRPVHLLLVEVAQQRVGPQVVGSRWAPDSASSIHLCAITRRAVRVRGSAVLVANHWCSICIHALNQLLEASDGFLAFPYLFGQNVTLALARQAREVGCPL